MNNAVCSGLSILELFKILICDFQYDYVKPKYGEKVKLFYTDTDSFAVNIKTNDIYYIVKILQKMLKLDLMLQIMNQIGHCLQGKSSKYSK